MEKNRVLNHSPSSFDMNWSACTNGSACASEKREIKKLTLKCRKSTKPTDTSDGLTSQSTHNKSFKRRAFPDNRLHRYWQPKISKQNTAYTPRKQSRLYSYSPIAHAGHSSAVRMAYISQNDCGTQYSIIQVLIIFPLIVQTISTARTIVIQ